MNYPRGGWVDDRKFMWGTRLGWSISFAIALITIALLYTLARLAGTTTPTTELLTTGKALENIELRLSPRDLLPAQNPDCDAGEFYRKAIAQYLADPRPYDDFLSNPRRGASLPAVDAILQGASCQRMTLLADRLEEVVTYEADKPPIVALRALGRATINLGLLSRDDPAAALKYYQAAFSLGVKLFDERVVFAELQAGEDLMSQAAAAMANLAAPPGNAPKPGELREFEQKRIEEYRQRIEPVIRVISSIDQAIVDRHAGDIRALAIEARERMWRVEATLALGRQRYFVGRAGDRRAAIRLLEKLARDADPAVQLAAKEALSLTPQMYRQLR
jgi:hypothetical protein